MTTVSAARGTSCVVRDAEPRDNAALRAIAAACPMRGTVELCIHREPDFFALTRLEGARARVGVAEADGCVVGCVMVAEREAYVFGDRVRTLYAGDLKVAPAWRGRGAADELSTWAARTGAELTGAGAPLLLTILAGNRAMERRTQATGNTPALRAFAHIRAYSIPLLWARGVAGSLGVRVARAAPADVEEMIDVWRCVAPARQFAPVLDAESFSTWIANAPGLELSSYRVARGRDGRIAGFLAWWDQSSFKQTRVVRYSPRLRIARHIMNAVATITGAPRLPGEHGELRHRTAVHVCVPGDTPSVLRALLQSAYGDVRADGCAFVNIGLDARDPLCAATTGLLAQPTDIGAYIVTPGGPWEGRPLDDRPLHYEIALV